MVRMSELHEQSELIQKLALFIRRKTEEKSLSSKDVGDWIKHSQSYAYIRLQGKASFTIDDLDALAPALGYKDIFALWRGFDTQLRYEEAKARGVEARPTPQPDEPSHSQLKPLTADIRAEIDDLEARLARSQARINQLKDYQIVADRSEREDEEWFD